MGSLRKQSLNIVPLVGDITKPSGILIPDTVDISDEPWGHFNPTRNNNRFQSAYTPKVDKETPDSHPANKDAVPIARWNVIPMQVANASGDSGQGETGKPYTGFPIGVVAFHANGIEKVEFYANGDDSKTVVTQMTVNPRTGNREFWVDLQLDPDDDRLIEIRAIVYPYKQGTPFVLQNVESYGLVGDDIYDYKTLAIDSDEIQNNYEALQQLVSPAFEAKYSGQGVYNEQKQVGTSVMGQGQHSMFLWGPNKFSNAKSLYVDPDWESTSNGTEDQPYKTIKEAWDDLKLNGFDGAEIVLMKPRSDNTYTLRNGFGSGGSSTAGWFTIRGGLEFAPPGQTWEAKDFVLGSSTDYNDGTRPVIRLNPKKFRFKDICLRAGSEVDAGDVQYVIPNGNYTMLWFDGVYSYDKKGRLTAESRGNGLVNSNQYINATFATNCTFFDKRKGSGGCTIIRNCSFDKSADTDQYSNSAMVLDCNSSRIRISPSCCREYYQNYPPELHEGNNPIPIDYTDDIPGLPGGKKLWADPEFGNIDFDNDVDENGVYNDARARYREYCTTSGVTGLFYRQLVDGHFEFTYPDQVVRYQPLIDEMFLEWNDNPPSGVSPSGRYSETEDIQRIYGYEDWQPGDDYPNKEEFMWVAAEDFGNKRYSLQYYYDDGGVAYKKPGDTVDNGCPHIDVWQLTGGSYNYRYKKNQICFGVHAWDVNDTQPMLLDQSRSNHSRIAIVDFSCEGNKDGPEGINLETGGPFDIWTNEIQEHTNYNQADPTVPPNGRVGLGEPSDETRGYSVVDHMVMSNCSFNVFIRVGRARKQSDGGSEDKYGKSSGLFANSVIQNSMFKSIESMSASDSIFQFDKYEPNTGIWVRHCVNGNSSTDGLEGDGESTAIDGTGYSKWKGIIKQPFQLICHPDRTVSTLPPYTWKYGIPMPGFTEVTSPGSLRTV